LTKGRRSQRIGGKGGKRWCRKKLKARDKGDQDNRCRKKKEGVKKKQKETHKEVKEAENEGR